MHKITPLDLLRQWLQAGEHLTYAQLTARLRLGEKQISRLIRQLRAEELPVQERRAGRHKIFALPPERQTVTVPDLCFDSAELRALAVASKASRAMLVGTPHAEALQRAFDKLLTRARPITYLFDVDEPLHDWQFDDNPADRIALDCFRQLEHAIDERQSVCIDYFTAGVGRTWTNRKIDPYFFAKRDRSWLLVAYCHERQAQRTFALPRISQVRACPDAFFEVPLDLDPEHYFQTALGAMASGETYVLRFVVTAPKAVYFRERRYHYTQLLEEERPDGSVVVSYELEGLDEMRTFCQSWGATLTVLDPPELRDILAREAALLVERYGIRC